ncbi:MAG: D-alanine--D-alanine ligase [Candidatus Omnitrophica bacterium]|nr:D-alanine--D-alanine ligase [Candidatus Omnitrophota bacterium]
MDKNLNGIKVGVLGGGVSNEREISLQSAHQASSVLRKRGFKTAFIDIITTDRDKVEKTIAYHKIDLAFIALHGEFGEDGKIQEILGQMNIPYTGSEPQSSYFAMDKIASKGIFIKQNIPTAPFIACYKEGAQPFVKKYPVVVKPYYAGSSIGISIVRKKSQLNEALREAFSLQDKVLIESYIEGRELTVGILEDKPLGVVEIVPKKGYFDFKTKYSDGMAEFIAPAALSQQTCALVQEAAIRAHTALGCRHFSRVDIRLHTEGTPYVLEVNSIPGLTTHSLLPLSARCCGISFDELILKMVTLAFYGQKQIQEIKKD